jgi:hypothetical protein
MDQSGATFSVIDVSAPKHPSVLGHLTDTTNFDYSNLDRLDISVVYDWRQSIAFAIGYGTHKIHAINVSDPTALRIESQLEDATYLYQNSAMDWDGKGRLFVGIPDSLTVVDVSNIEEMEVRGAVSSTSVFSNPTKVVYDSIHDRVFVVGGTTKLVVVDVSDTYSPSIVGFVTDGAAFNQPVYGLVLDAANKRAFVTSYSGDGVTEVDVRNSSNPIVERSIVDPTHLNGAWPIDIDVAGDRIFVGACEAGTGAGVKA